MCCGTTTNHMQNYNCKNCGAVLYWDTKENCLNCQYCGSKYQPEEFEDYTDTTEQVQSEEAQQEYTNATVGEDMCVYECKNCGGEIVTLKTTMATICPYCSEAVSITSKSAGDFRPKMCIPFSKDKEEITKLYKSYVNHSFLTPRKFKEQNTIEKYQGLFAPFYLHTIDDEASHVFEGEKLSSHRRGDDRVTVHSVYELQLDAEAVFERIPTDGSVRIDDKLMEAIEPFDYEGCRDYNPAYMAGFAAEQTDDEEQVLRERALQRAKKSMESKARESFAGYSSLMLKRDSHKIKSHESEYVMLPVWLLNVNYNGKKYTFAVNGQTGKVSGRLPMDKLKLTLLIAGTYLGTSLIAGLIMGLGGIL